MCKKLHPVDEAHYAWGEAMMDWAANRSDLGLKIEAEFARQDYLLECKKYGEEPVSGAMREIWSA